MDLAFGTNVREHYYSIGRLAGLEADARTHAVRAIVVSENGAADIGAQKRPLAAVPADHFDGDIELRAFSSGAPPGGHDGMMMLTDATRLMREGREIGHLASVEIDPATGEIVSVMGRHHWWTRRLHLKAAGLDFTVPGEIRVRQEMH
jgi:hypothetical protein